MKRHLKKTVTILLVLILLFTHSTKNVNAKDKDDELVSVLIYEDNQEIILAEVPLSKESDFREEIKNPERLQYYVDESRRNSMLRTPGNCKTKYHYDKDFLKVMSKLDHSFDYLAFITNPITGEVLKRTVAFMKSTTATQLTGLGMFGFLASVIGWSGASLQARQAAWWKDSYIMWGEKEINGVKLQLCENISGSSYPAAYRYITRY